MGSSLYRPLLGEYDHPNYEGYDAQNMTNNRHTRTYEDLLSDLEMELNSFGKNNASKYHPNASAHSNIVHIDGLE